MYMEENISPASDKDNRPSIKHRGKKVQSTDSLRQNTDVCGYHTYNNFCTGSL